MKISMMKEFIKLAEVRNYSRAAEDLFLAQPVLSRHIAAMEEELGTRLIRRTRSSFELTKAGEAALKDMKKIVSDYEKMREKLALIDASAGGELRLGALYYDMNIYVSRIRSVIRTGFPNIHLILKSYQPSELEKDLLEGRLDMIFVYGAEYCHRNDIFHMPLLKIPYLLICDKEHPLAKKEDFRMSDLNGQSVLMPDQPFLFNCVAEQFKEIIAANDLSFSATVPVSNYDEVPWILRDTGAVYVSPMANPSPYGDHTFCREIISAAEGCDVSAVWLKTNDNPVLPAVIKALSQSFAYTENA